MSLMSEEQALREVLGAVAALETETVLLSAARGRFAAEDAFAQWPLPMFDNSAMDGYAVRAADCASPGARLRVCGEQAAGSDWELPELRAGQAIRIFTGAPIPRGADAVVMQEDVRVENGDVILSASVPHGDNIRRAGGDLCEGQKIVARGDAITPQLAALLASQGFGKVNVSRAPRVAILTTGDELLAPGEPVAPGKIYESNGLMLAMLAEGCGAKVTRLGSATDEPDALREKLAAGSHFDALLVSGGVSVGERDLVKSELRKLGAQFHLWRVAVKPGKPFLFGQFGRENRCKVFGLPGNPVSSFVTFLLFVRPAILAMLGARELGFPKSRAVAACALQNDSDRPHYVRGKFDGDQFSPLGRQESHALFGLSQSNALVRVAPGETIAAGDRVAALSWG